MAWAYSKNKKCIYNWREKNKERNLEINRRYYKKRAIWLKVSKEFNNILL
jgi:hypothetical protein